MVTPWMENGNLVQFLKAHPDVDRLLLVRRLLYCRIQLPLTSFQAFDVSSGLTYLHRRKIVHGDLKAVRLFLYHDFLARH